MILKYIWQVKKPRIKLKMLQEFRCNGGFGLPDWELYYQASALTWLKEWVNLKNRRLLLIEGHDLQLGWHAFLWYGRSTAHKYFQRHYVRNAWSSLR